MSRFRNYLQGVSLGFLLQVFSLTAGFFLTPFFLHRLGERDWGLWLIAAQLMAYLALLDFGIVALVPREVAYAKGRLPPGSDPRVAIGAASASWQISLWQLPLVLLAMLGIWRWLPEHWEPLRPALRWLLFGFGALFPLRVFPAILQGLQEFSFLGTAQLVGWFLGTVVTVALVLQGYGIEALVVGWLVPQASIALAALWHLGPSLPFFLRPQGDSRLTAKRGRMRSGLWVGVGQVSQVLLNGTDITILGRIAGPGPVASYSLTGKLATVLSNKPALIAQASAPALAEIRSQGNTADALRVSSALTEMVMVVSGAVCVLVLAVNRGFITWWVGTRFFLGQTLTVLILVNLMFRHLATALAFSAFSFGRERELTFAGLFDGLLTLVVSIVLVKWLGPNGLPIAGICGVILFGLPLTIFPLARELKVGPLAILRPYWGWAWRFTILFLTVLGASRFYQPQGLFSIGLVSAGVVVLYAVWMWPYVLSSEMTPYLSSILSSIRKRWSKPDANESTDLDSHSRLQRRRSR